MSARNDQHGELRNTNQAAEMLGVHPATLKRWADDGIGPRFIIVNGRRRYAVSAIRKWMSGAA